MGNTSAPYVMQLTAVTYCVRHPS